MRRPDRPDLAPRVRQILPRAQERRHHAREPRTPRPPRRPEQYHRRLGCTYYVPGCDACGGAARGQTVDGLGGADGGIGEAIGGDGDWEGGLGKGCETKGGGREECGVEVEGGRG